MAPGWPIKIAARSGITQKLTFVQVISGPIASGLLLADGAGGLKGWQWLFIIEGLPTIVLGVWVHPSIFCFTMVRQAPSDIVSACRHR